MNQKDHSFKNFLHKYSINRNFNTANSKMHLYSGCKNLKDSSAQRNASTNLSTTNLNRQELKNYKTRINEQRSKIFTNSSLKSNSLSIPITNKNIQNEEIQHEIEEYK